MDAPAANDLVTGSEPQTGQGLTDQQSTAITTREVSIVLASGAGCGKTHVLTQRYLSHLEEGDVEVGQIVAITFTERAARQMRDRIRKAIRSYLENADSSEEEERWSKHLRGLETAPICTIHAFCGALLRQCSVEAGLDPHFEVLEDVLATCIENEALTSALQGMLIAKTRVADDLRALILLYGWKPVLESVQHLLHCWDEDGWQQWLDQDDEQILSEWESLAKTELIPRYLQYVLASRPKLSALLPLLKAHPPAPGPMATNVALLLEEVPLLPRSDNFAASVNTIAEAAKVGRQGAKAWPDPAVYDQIKDALKNFRDDLRGLKLDRFDLDREQMSDNLETARRFLRVTSTAMATYRERKRQHAVVDFQDLLILARNLLRDSSAVRARLQDRYRYLLIDELQDTDPVQMELVKDLCGGELTTGKLFAVGDHSQSIYRFRGADVHLFSGLRQEVPHEGRQGLTLNFRSQPAILEFTNALLEDHLTDYTPLQPFHPQINPEACIELLWSGADEADSAVESRMREAEAIAARIYEMVNSENIVVDREGDPSQLRRAEPGDIVLLFRAMTNVHLYEAALRRYGLDYYLVGGRAFFAQQEIYDVLNLLRALENPQDEVSLAGALRSPFCCLSDDALFLLRHSKPKEEEARARRRNLWDGLHSDIGVLSCSPQDHASILRARASLDRWRALKDQVTLSRLLGIAIGESGYDAATQVEHLGDRKLANLWKLVDLARTFDRSGLFTLADFIDRLGDLVTAQPREEQAATQPENANVVRLMSIHQAKGLEFPIVFIPDFDAAGGSSLVPAAHWDTTIGCAVRPPSDEEDPPFADYGWFLWKVREEIEEWSESLRTLYVGCTRAMDYLILSAALKPSKKPKSPWMLLLTERLEPLSGLGRDHLRSSVPKVTVRDRLTPIPPPKREQERIPENVTVEDLYAPPPDTLPISCDIGMSYRVITVDAIESFHFGKTDRLSFAEQSAQSSDRWASRWERSRSERSDLGEQWLHRVLQQWQWSRKRPWLQDLPSDEAGERAREWIAILAEHEHCQDVANASEKLIEQEILLEWTDAMAPLSFECSPMIRGFVECLWKDAMEKWHLIALTTEPLVGKGLKAIEMSKPGVAFAGWAIHQQTGDWPNDITLISLATGQSAQVGGAGFPYRKIFKQLAASLEQYRELRQDD